MDFFCGCFLRVLLLPCRGFRNRFILPIFGVGFPMGFPLSAWQLGYGVKNNIGEQKLYKDWQFAEVREKIGKKREQDLGWTSPLVPINSQVDHSAVALLSSVRWLREFRKAQLSHSSYRPSKGCFLEAANIQKYKKGVWFVSFLLGV